METGADFARLTIKGSKGTDGGKFRVVAENEVGRDEKELTVIVMGEYSKYKKRYTTFYNVISRFSKAPYYGITLYKVLKRYFDVK